MEIIGTDYDPFLGLGMTAGVQDGKLVIRTEGDAQPGIEYAKARALDPDVKKRGIEQSMMEALHIPDPVGLEILGKYGFNVWTAHASEILRFIERHPEYHHCKTINGRVA